MDSERLTELRDLAEAARDAQEAYESGADQPGSRALYDAWRRATERMGYAIRPDVIVGILDALDEANARLATLESALAAIASECFEPTTLPDGCPPLVDRILGAIRELAHERTEARTEAHDCAERIATLEAALPTGEERYALASAYDATVEHATGGCKYRATPTAERELATLREWMRRLSAATSQAQQTPTGVLAPLYDGVSPPARDRVPAERGDSAGPSGNAWAEAFGACPELEDPEPPAPAVPPPGVVRCESFVEIGDDGRYIVWERDTACEGRDSAEYAAWRKRARRVDFTVDIPIHAIAAEIRGAG